MHVKLPGLRGSDVTNPGLGIDPQHSVAVRGADAERSPELGVLPPPTTQAPLQVDEVFDTDILAIAEAVQGVGQGTHDTEVDGQSDMPHPVRRKSGRNAGPNSA